MAITGCYTCGSPFNVGNHAGDWEQLAATLRMARDKLAERPVAENVFIVERLNALILTVEAVT